MPLSRQRTSMAKQRARVEPEPPMQVKVSKKTLVKIYGGGEPNMTALALARPAGVRMFTSTVLSTLGPCAPKNHKI